MSTAKDEKPKADIQMPSAEEVQRELASAESMDDLFGKEGIFARLFSKTLEQMLEAEMTEHLGYEPYEAKGRNSGNNRNGHYGEPASLHWAVEMSGTSGRANASGLRIRGCQHRYNHTYIREKLLSKWKRLRLPDWLKDNFNWS